MEDYQVRAVEEHEALNEKCAKLVAFVDDEEKMGTLSPIDQDLLKTQMSCMLAYLQILVIRIKLFTTIEDEEPQSETQE